jgi:hypothetical protein
VTVATLDRITTDEIDSSSYRWAFKLGTCMISSPFDRKTPQDRAWQAGHAHAVLRRPS